MQTEATTYSAPAPAEAQTSAPAHNVMADVIARHEAITYRAKRK